MKLNQLIKNLPFKVKGNKTKEIKGILIHSKKVFPGCLFVAMRGNAVDGHNFIHEAVLNGATAVLLEKTIPWLPKHVTQIVADDPRLYIATLASRFYQHPSRSLEVIAITGTNGKTSCCWYVQQIAHQLGLSMGRCGTLGADTTRQLYDSALTTPDSVELHRILAETAQNGADGLVLEASSQGLVQKRLEEVELDTAIFTNLSEDHLDYHKSMEAYAKAKSHLFTLLQKSSKKNKQAVAFLQTPHFDEVVAPCKDHLFTFGIGEGDLKISEIVHRGERLQFYLETAKQRAQVCCDLAGEHSALNIAASISHFLLKGYTLSQCAEACSSLLPPLGRMQRVHNQLGIDLFIDFAHSPDALKRTLATIKEAYNKKITLVFGCGGDRDKEKRPLMGKVAVELADRVFVTSDNPRHEDPLAIIDDICAGAGSQDTIYRQPDRRKAIQEAIGATAPGELLLVAGKGHETHQIIGDLKMRFNDAEVCQELLHGDFSSNQESSQL